MTSKQHLGREYRVKTLKFLARTGYATTRQIAKAVWGSCEVSDRKMAGRTIRRLRTLGYLVSKRDGNPVAGEQMVALTRAGVTALAEFAQLPDGRAHARDWLRHAHSHRTACNSVYAAVVRGLAEDVGFTELEIRAGSAPAPLSMVPFQDGDGCRQQKIPDLLLHGASGPIWVEVENSWRGAKDFDKLVHFLRCIFARPEPLVEKVWFVVVAPGAKTIGKRLHAALTHTATSGYPRQIRELDAKILRDRVAVFHLDQAHLTLTPVDLAGP